MVAIISELQQEGNLRELWGASGSTLPHNQEGLFPETLGSSGVKKRAWPEDHCSIEFQEHKRLPKAREKHLAFLEPSKLPLELLSRSKAHKFTSVLPLSVHDLLGLRMADSSCPKYHLD